MWREKLHTFHLTGCGLEEFEPTETLHPVDSAQANPSMGSDCSPVLFHLAGSLSAVRRPARQRLLAEIEQYRNRLSEILSGAEGSDLAHAAEQLAASLGKGGAEFLDPMALVRALRASSAKGSASLDPARRKRLTTTVAALNDATEWLSSEPLFWLLQSSELPELTDIVGGGVRRVEDATGAAEQLCSQLADRMAALLRALRTARLECEGAFREDVHTERLSHLSWQSATKDELAAFPAVVVAESVETLASQRLASLGRLLRSGVPVQILGFRYRLGPEEFTWIAVAHPEVLLVESALSKPDHWKEGLHRMVLSSRAAVAIVNALPHGSLAYVYDPQKGDSLSERFCIEAAGPPEFTPAHVAAMLPEWRAHFRVISESMWDSEQLILGDYLDHYLERPPSAVPFLLVDGKNGTPSRALLSRELANLCRESRRSRWMLEELAGIRKAEPQPASAAAPAEAGAAVEERIRVAMQQGVKEGTIQTVLRVVALLLDSKAPVAAAPSPPATAALRAEEPQVERPAQDTQAAAEPYIDSFLCTSCNDCFKINPRLFHYNENKQAYIADRNAGSYAELVKAAESCPAKCIHVGDPRPADRSAIGAVLARAAKYR